MSDSEVQQDGDLSSVSPKPASAPGVSPARKIISLILLILLLVVAGLEFRASLAFNSAVAKLQARLDLLAKPDAPPKEKQEQGSLESINQLVGRQPDGELKEQDAFLRTTYTWKSLLQTLTVVADFQDLEPPVLFDMSTARKSILSSQ